MTMAQRIHDKLTQAFAPTDLEIIDESHKHAGHSGAHADGESHFRVVLVASAFEGLSRVERQRRVYQVLADELAERVHALSLSVKASHQE